MKGSVSMAENTPLEGLKVVIERMVVDEAFKKAVLENPEKAIADAGYHVSAEELLAIKNLEGDDLQGLTPELIDERLSKCYALTAYTENIQS
jgi:hypothetical protein